MDRKKNVVEEEEELPDIDELPAFFEPTVFTVPIVRKLNPAPPVTKPITNSTVVRNGNHNLDRNEDSRGPKAKELDKGTEDTSPIPSSSKTSGKKVTPVPSAIGVKDSDGFLAPPPASTLLIRRTRTSSTGSSTYVVSSPSAPTTGDTPPVKRRFSSSDASSSGSAVKRSSMDSVKSSRHHSSQHSGSGSGSHKSTSQTIAKFKKGMKDKDQQNRKDMMKRVGKIKERLKVKNPINIDPTTGKRRYKRRSNFTLYPKHLKKHTPVVVPEPEPEPEYEVYTAGPANSLTWRPNDDLRLIINAVLTKDLKQVHMGVKFSCRFTLEEIKNRWRSLLYDEKISKVATTACRNIHSKVKHRIYSEALFSEDELSMIQSIKSDQNPTLETFEVMLRDNLLIFHQYRTAKSLQKYWTELKDLNMLKDQNIKHSFERGGENFSDFESSVNDDIVRNFQVDPSVLEEIVRENRRNKKRIRMLEEEISTWQDLAELVWEGQIAKAPQFDDSTFAILRGKNVRFAMAAKEITLGRRTENNWVDADLSEEGTDHRVSRRQGTIKMRALGDFVILNQGKHAMYINGQALLPGECACLRDQSVIKVSQLNFVFIVNEKLLYELRKKILEDESNAEHVNVQSQLQPSKSKETNSSKKNSAKDGYSKSSQADKTPNPSSPWSRTDSVIVSPKKSKPSTSTSSQEASTSGKFGGHSHQHGDKPVKEKKKRQPKKPKEKLEVKQPEVQILEPRALPVSLPEISVPPTTA